MKPAGGLRMYEYTVTTCTGVVSTRPSVLQGYLHVCSSSS